MALPGLLRFRLDAEHLPLEWVTIQRIPGRTSGSSAEAVQRWQRDTRPIGKGGYGKVWREHLDHGDRHVDFRAVKVCDADSDVNQRELQALMEFTQLSVSYVYSSFCIMLILSDVCVICSSLWMVGRLVE